MNRITLIGFCLLLFSGCSPYLPGLPTSTCGPSSDIGSGNSPNANAMQQTVRQLVRAGVPGCAMAVYSDNGWWTTAAGYAKIEDKTPMEACHLQYLQSISKLYMAVAVLTLYERGKINLDEPITKYLPTTYSQYVTNVETITVRMLLNHTSGIPEYNFAPSYVTYLLQHPKHTFSATDYLGYIKGKPLDFAPGSRYGYRNTNYVLLALMTDALTGDHARYITETILTPLGLTQTLYRNQAGYPNYPNLVNSYWDRHSDGVVENVSRMQQANVASLTGDDGLVATPADAVRFLKGLMEGKLLSDKTMEQMKTWVVNKAGKPAYGLGLAYATVQGQVAYGHTGGGIGAGCELYYFPEKRVYVFIGINLGTVTDSPLHKEAGKALEELLKATAQ